MRLAGIPREQFCPLLSTYLPTLFSSSSSQELIIPLASDTAFFRTLCEALEGLSAYLVTKRAEFEKSLQTLSHDISSAARPSSSSSSFHAYSPFTTDPASISVSTGPLALMHKSDLETWRQIFQLYAEADIFQGHQERFRGERDVEDAEARLAAFTARLHESLANGSLKLRLKQSRTALNSFMELNTFILNLRKVCSGLVRGSPCHSPPAVPIRHFRSNEEDSEEARKADRPSTRS